MYEHIIHSVKEEKRVGVDECSYGIHVRGRRCCINSRRQGIYNLGPHQWPTSVASGAQGYRPRRAGCDRARAGKRGAENDGARGTVNGYRDGVWDVPGDRSGARAAARRALRVVFVTAPSLLSVSLPLTFLFNFHRAALRRHSLIAKQKLRRHVPSAG